MWGFRLPISDKRLPCIERPMLLMFRNCMRRTWEICLFPACHAPKIDIPVHSHSSFKSKHTRLQLALRTKLRAYKTEAYRHFAVRSLQKCDQELRFGMFARVPKAEYGSIVVVGTAELLHGAPLAIGYTDYVQDVCKASRAHGSVPLTSHRSAIRFLHYCDRPAFVHSSLPTSSSKNGRPRLKRFKGTQHRYYVAYTPSGVEASVSDTIHASTQGNANAKRSPNMGWKLHARLAICQVMLGSFGIFAFW